MKLAGLYTLSKSSTISCVVLCNERDLDLSRIFVSFETITTVRSIFILNFISTVYDTVISAIFIKTSFTFGCQLWLTTTLFSIFIIIIII